MIKDVYITRQALKELKRSPHYIQAKFRAWLVAVNKAGVMELENVWDGMMIHCKAIERGSDLLD